MLPRFITHRCRVAVTASLSALLLFCEFPVSSQTKWFKYDGNPVVNLGPAGSWDDEFIHVDRVILQDSLYRMWYTGGWTKSRIGYATSRDGARWKKDDSNPVLDFAPGTWESAVHRAYVIVNGPHYHMWYTGDNLLNLRIGYASSADGKWWKKHAGNPILSNGPPESWEGVSSGLASVVGPDSIGGYKMWYQGSPGMKIGYATATDETTWTKYSANPVLFDDDIVYYPRVLHGETTYEMWYGFKPQPGVFRYATSFDGIHWAKAQDISVLRTGPYRTWDDAGIIMGDVVFDGKRYFMWYNGDDGSGRWRGGFAVSPKGMDYTIAPSNAYVKPGSGRVRISALLLQSAGVSISASIKEPGQDQLGPEAPLSLLGTRQVALLGLFDDGKNGDSVAHDKIFSNSWVPPEEKLYFVDLRLRLHQNDTLNFTMNKAAVFTSIGPVALQNVLFAGDSVANPGDTILVTLVLRNLGSSSDAGAVTASLSPTDPSISSITETAPRYGNIAAGASAAPAGYYRVYVNPYSPLETTTKINVTISSWGIPLWYDTFTLHVMPPWWRTTWAYGAYLLAGVFVIWRLRLFERNRQRMKHQMELEHVEAEKLREVDQMKSRFFANVSHEFRTPLTLILGPLETLIPRARNEDETRAMYMMHRNARRLLRLINQLLDISKLEAGRMKLEASPANIVSFARAIAQSFQPVGSRKEVSLRTESDSETIELYFDRDKMEKILSNLLSNAFKFTKEGGEVILSVRHDESHRDDGPGGTITITIADTGIGISKEELPHIFDRFYQVDGSQTGEKEGTGIGLALVKELVDLHHGTIRVTSSSGSGTTFTLRFPAGRAHLKEDEIVRHPHEEETRTTEAEASLVEETAIEPPGDVPSIDTHHALVLVVEDNADIRSYIRECLVPTFEVFEARDGDEGVNSAIETVPDLIISDVMMPQKDGYELCRILKQDEKTSHIPIILLTAKAGTESKIEGLQTGSDDYIVKPFEAKELLVRVKNLIDQRRLLRKKFQRELVIQPMNVEVKSVDELFITKTLAVIESHLSESTFDTAALAEAVAMSRMQLHRKLRALAGISPGELIRSFRMKRAASLLQQKAGNVSEIAYEVGYSNPSHFAQAFREQFGVTPSDFSLLPDITQQ